MEMIIKAMMDVHTSSRSRWRECQPAVMHDILLGLRSKSLKYGQLISTVASKDFTQEAIYTKEES